MERVKKKLHNELSDTLSLRVKVSDSPDQRAQPVSRVAAAFIAPELVDVGMPEDISGFDQKPSWDVAVRFQDLKRLGNIPDKEKLRLRKRAIEGVLERAHRILGSVLKPERNVLIDYRTYIESGQRGELDVLATLEEGLSRGLPPERINDLNVLRFDAREAKDTEIALVMDASLSMTGEKIALLAVSTAVVALCIPSARLALMGFDSRTRWIKKFGSEMKPEEIVERVLELPAGGFTNLELAFREADKVVQQQHRGRANVILISDGKYTEGADPTPLASRFRHLNVLKIGRDQAGRELLLDVSCRGNGRFFEARRIEDLPRTMYGAIRTLLR